MAKLNTDSLTFIGRVFMLVVTTLSVLTQATSTGHRQLLDGKISFEPETSHLAREFEDMLEFCQLYQHVREHAHESSQKHSHLHITSAAGRSAEGLHMFSEALDEQIEEAYQQTQIGIQLEIDELQGTGFIEDDISVHGIGHKLIWDFFPPIYPCPVVWIVGRERSTGDNSKYICGSALPKQKHCLVYSFGSNAQTGFEQDIIQRTGCEVHIFDPTLSPEEVAAVQTVQGATFHDIGLRGSGNLRRSNQTYTYSTENAKTMTLAGIMQMLGHSWIDVLKIDVEDNEWDFFQDYTRTGLLIPATQMQVELHHFSNRNSRTDTANAQLIFDCMVNLTHHLHMRPFHSEPNWWWGNDGKSAIEYAFLNVNHNGHLVGPWNAEETQKQMLTYHLQSSTRGH